MKKAKKLVLSKETVMKLEDLGKVQGGDGSNICNTYARCDVPATDWTCW